jgi:hypothetical protein
MRRVDARVDDGHGHPGADRGAVRFLEPDRADRILLLDRPRTARAVVEREALLAGLRRLEPLLNRS